MKNHLRTVSILSLLITSMAATAQQRTTLTPSQQKRMELLREKSAKYATSTSTETANKGTGTQKERVKAIFVNYGSGDDSLKFYYTSNVRGSSFYYARMGEYDGGYNYLGNPLAQIQFDSLDYITRTDHTSPYGPYLQATAQYDALNRPVSGRRNTSKFFTAYTAAGDIAQKVTLTLNATTGNYDTSDLILNTYFAAGKLLTAESYTWAPTKTGNPYGRMVNTYDGQGNQTTHNTYDWDGALNAWATLPAQSIITVYIGSDPVTVTTRRNYAGGDTTQMRYTYNAANQIEVAEQYLFTRSHPSTGLWDTLNITKYTFPSGGANWTKSKTIMHDPTSGNWGFLNDSMSRVFDAQNQLLSIQEFNDDGLGNAYTYNKTQIWYATGKTASSYGVYLQPGVDTFSLRTTLTFNASGNPVTCKTLVLDAYGGPNPDTVTNTQDKYYYETYIDPTAIATTMPARTLVDVFPNPANSTIHLRCTAMNTATMTMTNANGQTVRTHAVLLGNNVAVLPITDLPSGVYYITLEDSQQHAQANVKFLKQ